MEKRQLGKTDMYITKLGFGGEEIRNANIETVESLLGNALNAGLNIIDTAECYGNSEELIGNTVSHRRDEYYLFSKCGHEGVNGLPDWDPKMLELSIDRSLKRLNTDYLDLMQLHTCTEETLRQGDVIEVLQKAREKGKIRYLGYSGDRNDALYAVKCGAFDVLQTSTSVADQESISLTIPEAKNRGMGVIAKRPIANAAWRFGEKPENPYHHVYWERLQELDYDFMKDSIQASVEIALRFTLSIDGVDTAIVGTANPSRWQENAKLVEKGPLSKEMFDYIRTRWSSVASSDWKGQN